MSKKEDRIVKKVSGLLKQLNCREFLHHFGPKKYKLKQHVVALLLKETLRCSFRRISKLLTLLGFVVPSYSALCKSRKRIPLSLWNSFLNLTSKQTSGLVAIDGTGLSRTNPSHHYMKRINRRKPVKSYAKLSALFDLKSKQFLALKVRAKPRHDIKDVRPLLRKTKGVRKLFGDSAYDAESLHEYCFDRNIKTIVKPKKNARRGFYRKKQRKNFSEQEYHQRSLIESGFGSLKRKYGGNVLARRASNIKVEVHCKAIAHNLGLLH